MSRFQDADYLAHMDNTIRRIEASQVANNGIGLVAGTEQADATLFRLATIGESVKNLSTDVKDVHPDVPWREIKGFRDQLVHNVLSLDMGTVQNVVDEHLPTLREVVGQELLLSRKRPPPEIDGGLSL